MKVGPAHRIKSKSDSSLSEGEGEADETLEDQNKKKPCILLLVSSCQ